MKKILLSLALMIGTALGQQTGAMLGLNQTFTGNNTFNGGLTANGTTSITNGLTTSGAVLNNGAVTNGSTESTTGLFTALGGITSTGTNSFDSLNKVVYAVSDYSWTQSPSGSLTAATPATITLTPCPKGIDTSNNTAAQYGVYISGTGTPEAVAVTGGSCTSGAGSGSITFTPGFNHSAGYTLSSASGGNQEAINVADGGNSVIGGGTTGFPFAVIQEVPAGSQSPNYNIYWPVFLNSGKSTIMGYGAFWNCFTRSACLIVGNYNGGTSGRNVIFGLTFLPGTNVDGTFVTSVSAASGTYTVNTSGNHNLVPGDYAIIYYSTPVQTQEARVLVASTPSATQFTYALGSSTFALSNGFGNVALENTAIEDITNGTSLVDVRLQNTGGAKFNQGIVISIDQAATIERFSTLGSGSVRCGSNYCGNMIYIRGDQGAAPVVTISHSDISLQCAGNGIRDAAGNTLKISDTVIQGFPQYGVYYAGGLQTADVDNVYQEVGNCTNPFYPGSGLAQTAQAGYIIGTGLAIRGTPPIAGGTPTFVSGGSTLAQRNYFVIPQDSLLGNGPMMYIGKALPTDGSVSIPLAWPSPALGTAGTRTFDILVTIGQTTIAPYGSTAQALFTGISGSCNSAGICTATDTQGATTPYTISTNSWVPTLPFWPGAVILNAGASLYTSQVGTSAGIISTTWLPRVFVDRCVTVGSSPSYSPFWVTTCSSGDALSNSADLKPLNPTGQGTPSGITGVINLTPGPKNLGLTPRQIITTLDSNTAQTLATPGYIRQGLAGDSFIGTDTTGSIGTQDQTYGAPGGHVWYVNDPGTSGTSWLQKLTTANETIKVPLVLNSNLSILGTCLQGCGPFIPGGSQASDTFIRANGSLGANWSDQDGSWSVASNQATFTIGGDSRALTAYTGTSFSANQFASVAIAATTAGCQGPAVRVSSSANTAYVLLACSINTGEVIRIVAGVTTLLASYSITPTIGDVLRLEVNGNKLTALRNGVALGAVLTDNNIASGSPGLGGASVTGGLVNFTGGDLLFTSKYITALSPGTFGVLAACTSTNEGSMAAVKDATTNTWGATVVGGGGNHVMAYCDGTNWTVAAQ